ncbi:MAG: CPBP family intramembrane glutamic endopeptidase [Methanobacteriaceae archaeon]
MKEPINWKLFWILLGACVFSVIAIIPYTLTLQAQLRLLEELPVPSHILLPIQILENAIMFAIAIFVGLYLAKKVGLGAPILESWLEGKETRGYLKSILAISIASGAMAGFLIILLDFMFFDGVVIFPQVTVSIWQIFWWSPVQKEALFIDAVPIWQRFLATFYAGIAEEVMMRLFLMTLLVWVFYKIKKTAEGKPTNFGMWLAIIITEVLFSVGHLLATANLIQNTGLFVIRTIVLSSIGGVIFGWLYWKKGLESAMLSHFSAAIVLRVFSWDVVFFILPLIRSLIK